MPPLQSKDFTFLRGGKPLDMTLPWRLLGLPRNAKLELEPVARPGSSSSSGGVGATAQVVVAIPGAGRVPVTPKLATTVASVLRGLEALGHFPEGVPVSGCQVVYLRRSVSGAQLESTSLSGKSSAMSAAESLVLQTDFGGLAASLSQAMQAAL